MERFNAPKTEQTVVPKTPMSLDEVSSWANSVLSSTVLNAVDKINVLTSFYTEYTPRTAVNSPKNSSEFWSRAAEKHAAVDTSSFWSRTAGFDAARARALPVLAEAIASQLGYKSDFGTEAFIGCSDETIKLMAEGIRASRLEHLLFGNQGQTTLIRSGARCEDKIDFLFRLKQAIGPRDLSGRDKEANEKLSAINKLIMGQLEFIKNQYPSDALIRGIGRDVYIRSIEKRL